MVQHLLLTLQSCQHCSCPSAASRLEGLQGGCRGCPEWAILASGLYLFLLDCPFSHLHLCQTFPLPQRYCVHPLTALFGHCLPLISLALFELIFPTIWLSPGGRAERGLEIFVL